jgi:hypothetical protein
MSSIKVVGNEQQARVVCQVAAAGATQARFTGLRAAHKPKLVEFGSQSFWVGAGAHQWGRPIENLDYDRFGGSVEMRALAYAVLSELSVGGQPALAVVGLPLEYTQSGSAKAAVSGWLKGEHRWACDGKPFKFVVEDVRITSQTVGALMDYVLDEKGKPRITDARKKELGAISIGFNTVELQAVSGLAPVPVLTRGARIGVRNMLLALPQRAQFSLGELDALLCKGQLHVNSAQAGWEREVSGFVDEVWGRKWERFAHLVGVGGGMFLAKDLLAARFGGKLLVAEDTLFAIARGLRRIGLSQRQ